MNCCDYNCHQGRDCPARKHTRKVKAGGPPPPDLPIDFANSEPEDTYDREMAMMFSVGVGLSLATVLAAVAFFMGQ